MLKVMFFYERFHSTGTGGLEALVGGMVVVCSPCCRCYFSHPGRNLARHHFCDYGNYLRDPYGQGQTVRLCFGLDECAALCGYRLSGDSLRRNDAEPLVLSADAICRLVFLEKHMDSNNGEVLKRRLTKTGRLISFVAILAGTILYAFILKKMGDSLPFVDAFTTIASIYALFASVKRFAEQWIVWIIIDAASVYMWAMTFVNTAEYIATLVMWCVYLLNAVIMFIKWMRGSREQV